MAAYTHTIFPGYVPDGFFDSDNIAFIKDKTARVLKGEFFQYINIDKGSIVRVMQRVLGERMETVPKMNQRTIMYLCNEFRNYQSELKRNLKWEENYISSQRLYDPVVEKSAMDTSRIKLSNRLGKPTVGGTSRFVFM